MPSPGFDPLRCVGDGGDHAGSPGRLGKLLDSNIFLLPLLNRLRFIRSCSLTGGGLKDELNVYSFYGEILRQVVKSTRIDIRYN